MLSFIGKVSVITILIPTVCYHYHTPSLFNMRGTPIGADCQHLSHLSTAPRIN